MNTQNTLILTVGLPRSGKSTWAKSQGLPIVSPDAIRLALHGQAFIATAEPIIWATAKLMVASLFQAGHETVILDACSHKKARRDEWADGRWQCKYAIFAATLPLLNDRALASGREELLPVIERMWAEHTHTPIDDGIDPHEVCALLDQ
jgi:predicted kinase